MTGEKAPCHHTYVFPYKVEIFDIFPWGNVEICHRFIEPYLRNHITPHECSTYALACKDHFWLPSILGGHEESNQNFILPQYNTQIVGLALSYHASHVAFPHRTPASPPIRVSSQRRREARHPVEEKSALAPPGLVERLGLEAGCVMKQKWHFCYN